MRPDRYLREVRRWVGGSGGRRQRVVAELEVHLREADAAGELDRTLSRLGTPREAARSFVGGEGLEPAPRRKRIAAGLIDLAPFLGLVVAAYWPPTGWPGTWPTWLPTADFSDFLRRTLLWTAFLWWPVFLTLLEGRFGQTPGKRLLGLHCLSEDGTAPSLGQAALRRALPFFSGPLQVVDWMFLLSRSGHQRAFDRVAQTVVVEEAAAPPLWLSRGDPEVSTRGAAVGS